ncbi:MAG: DNA translocase FtsK 4TM domain-containing protein [Clostridia bacterium]|nr:DNA translocase FtsK 4TM domain-containing protein [Clostridia bacterium]
MANKNNTNNGKKYKVTSKSKVKGKGSKNAKSAVQKSSLFIQFLPFILFIISILMIISFFAKDFGSVGNFIRDKVFFGMFSLAYYALPFLLAAIGIILLLNDDAPKRKYILISSVTFLIVDTLCHLIFASDAMMKQLNPFEHFKEGVAHRGGGFVGGFTGGLLSACFSRVGAFIIVAAASVVLVMIAMKKTPKDAANAFTDSMKRRTEQRDVRRAEREQMLKERREREEEKRLAEEERAAFARQNDVQTSDDAPDEEEGGDVWDIDTSVFEGERKTEFDPTITDEDFPLIKGEIDDEDADEYNDVSDVIELDPVDKSEDKDDGLTLESLDGLDDEEVLARLSKTFLGGDGDNKLKVEEKDIGEGAVEEAPHPYAFPDINLLVEDTSKKNEDYKRELQIKETKLIQTLEKFNVHTESAGLPSKGPTVTRYELRPAPGTRVRAIVNLVDDIALSLATSGIRIEAPIPGKSAVGIEVPNDEPMIVRLRTLIDSDKFRDAESRLTVALGEDVAGAPIFFDISKMPHLLIAGATGMGKSVCINCLIMSLLYKATPEEVQLILVDPKKVEFNIYEGLPHLIVPVVSDPKKAAGALSWAVNEMERRFGIIEEAKVRNITGYNDLVKDDPEKKMLPHVVIIIDELADLMMTAPDSVENSIARLAQKARAAGMHLIIGTQRPSVDVITGTIKNNIPSRIACKVSSQIDSRTVIDTAGAEKLIGKGDMLFNPVGAIKTVRVQGAFVTDTEIDRVVEFLKENNTGDEGYNDDVMNEIETEAVRCTAKKRDLVGITEDISNVEADDPMFWRAVELAVESGKISTSLIQRKCSLGFGRAAKLIDRMEERGFVSAPDGQKPRQVLITKERLQEIKMGAPLSDNAPAKQDDDSDDFVF